MTLTDAGATWADARERMARLRRRLAGHGLEWLWVVEPNDDGQRTHIHVVGRGDLPEFETLQDHAVAAGFGAVLDAGSVRSRKAVGLYLTKNARDRPGPNGELGPRAARHLELNGNRLSHQSHRFWMTRAGTPTNLKGAERRRRVMGRRWRPAPPSENPTQPNKEDR